MKVTLKLFVSTSLYCLCCTMLLTDRVYCTVHSEGHLMQVVCMNVNSKCVSVHTYYTDIGESCSNFKRPN